MVEVNQNGDFNGKEPYQQEFYPISEAKKALLEKQSLEVVLQVLSDMASWSTCGGKLVWK